MAFGNYNYEKCLRKSISAFGSCFNSLLVRRSRADGSTEDYRVPLVYAPKEKWVRRLREPSSITDKTKVEITLPAMSFIITSLAVDRSRARNRKSERICNVDGDEGTVIPVEIPVNITLNLFVYTRNITDTLTIIEHIVGNFLPENMLQINYQNDTNNAINASLSLEPGLIMNERYDGDYEQRRVNISSLSFVMKTYIFKSTSTTTIIDTIDNDTTLDEE